MKNRVLSVHQEHELLMKLEQAGLNETDAQAVIENRGNTLAKKVVELVRVERLGEDWFTFTTTTASLRQLWDLNPDICLLPIRWLDQPFADKKGKVGVLHLRTSAHPGSFSKNWNEGRELLEEGEFVPTVRDLVEGMIAYYRETGRRLFSDYSVSAQDVSFPLSRRVYVRFYPGGKIDLGQIKDNDRSHLLGLSVARKSA